MDETNDDDFALKSRKEIKDKKQEEVKKEQSYEPGPAINGMYEYMELGTSICLVLKTDSAAFTLPYTYFHGAEYDPTKGIKIYHSTFDVLIKGRNLQPIYNLLNQYALVSVRKAAHNEPEIFDSHIDDILIHSTDRVRDAGREALGL